MLSIHITNEIVQKNWARQGPNTKLQDAATNEVSGCTINARHVGLRHF